jgi:hypothetical protein
MLLHMVLVSSAVAFVLVNQHHKKSYQIAADTVQYHLEIAYTV